MKSPIRTLLTLKTAILAALILGGASLMAQMPPSPFDRMLDRLGVESGKRDGLKKIFNQAKTDQMKFRLQMEKKQIELKELLIADKTDMGKVKQYCDESSKIFSEMQFSQLTADNEIKKLLTQDQWMSYVEMRGAMGHMEKRPPMMEGRPEGKGK
ncbi:MAG: hypothetical protein JNM63_04555 [Spirochaetia bacterium]|nr:hypothetical protein [Spirochaetia bacterium]